jgi:hypothetical protein
MAAAQIAEVYAWRNRAYAQHDGGLVVMKSDFLFTNLYSDPRWTSFLRKMNLPT